MMHMFQQQTPTGAVDPKEGPAQVGWPLKYYQLMCPYNETTGGHTVFVLSCFSTLWAHLLGLDELDGHFLSQVLPVPA